MTNDPAEPGPGGPCPVCGATRAPGHLDCHHCGYAAGPPLRASGSGAGNGPIGPGPSVAGVTAVGLRGWVALIMLAIPFVLGVGLVMVSPKESSAEHLGVGLIFGEMGLFVLLIVAAVAVRQVRAGMARGGWISVAGQLLILLGVLAFMLTGFLSAIGFAGSTLVTGPDSPLEPLVRAGFALLAAGIPLSAVRPPNLEGAPDASYGWRMGWQNMLFALLASTAAGRAAFVMVGIYLGWFVFFGRSTLLDLAVVVTFFGGLVAGVVTLIRVLRRD